MNRTMPSGFRVAAAATLSPALAALTPIVYYLLLNGVPNLSRSKILLGAALVSLPSYIICALFFAPIAYASWRYRWRAILSIQVTAGIFAVIAALGGFFISAYMPVGHSYYDDRLDLLNRLLLAGGIAGALTGVVYCGMIGVLPSWKRSTSPSG